MAVGARRERERERPPERPPEAEPELDWPALRELRELEEQTQVGALLLAALMRRQLRLSLGVAAAFGLVLLSQPLLARLWPAYPELTLLSIPLPWLVLGAAAYPVMVLLGLFYARRAQAIDDEFSDLLRS